MRIPPFAKNAKDGHPSIRDRDRAPKGAFVIGRKSSQERARHAYPTLRKKREGWAPVDSGSGQSTKRGFRDRAEVFAREGKTRVSHASQRTRRMRRPSIRDRDRVPKGVLWIGRKS